MKTIKFIVTAIFAVAMSVNIFAQNHDHSKMSSNKTETFKVSGNCDMCKATIEKAAKINGVSKAVWDKKAKVITVSYDTSKVKIDDVHKKIAAAGYDTEKVKAADNVYAKLPSCCKYKR
jgi:copper chaperone CopZ